MVVTEPNFQISIPPTIFFSPQHSIFRIFSKKSKIADFRAKILKDFKQKTRDTKIEERALSLSVEIFSEYIAANPNFLACSVTKISFVTARECCRNKILRKSHLNLGTPNLHHASMLLHIDS